MTKHTEAEWKKEFDKTFASRLQYPNFPETDFRPILKDFIRTLLADERKKIVGVVEGMKKKGDFLTTDHMFGYREALSDIITALTKEVT